MSGSLTENRLLFHRQGVVQTAANTTYPVTVLADYIANVGWPANSNTNGIRMPERYANQRLVARVSVNADDAPTCAVAVYGYVRKVLEPTDSGISASNTFTLMDYTGSDPNEVPWDHLLTLNNGAVISVTTNAVGAVNVISQTASSFIYNEVFTVGAMYERILMIPIVLTGTTPLCFLDLAFAGGQK